MIIEYVRYHVISIEKKITSSGKTTELPVLLDGGAHPVDLGVAGDGGVVDVDHDNLVVPE